MPLLSVTQKISGLHNHYPNYRVGLLENDKNYGITFEIAFGKSNIMKYFGILTAILGFVFFQSCTSQNGTSTGQTTNLELSGNWTLIQFDDASDLTIEEAFPNKKPTLVLESISKKLTGNTGCNQMFGSFSTQQNQISFTGLGSTKMYCDGVKETEYLNLLNTVDSYKLIENQLVFMDKSGKEILKYSK